jgi:NitT/TauT family transport system substrate-binding protein
VARIDRRRFVAAATAALATPLVARAADAQSTPAALTPVRVVGAPNDDLTAIVYAWKSGMYQKAGLDVSVAKSNSGAAGAVAVAGGAADIGKASTTSIFDAHIRGVPFTLVAPASDYDSKIPYGGFLFAANSPIKTGKDAEGQTVAVASLASLGHVAFAAWVEQHGGDPKLVKFVEIPFPAVPPALDQNRIVAGETTQPTQGAAVARGFGYKPIYDALGPRFAGSVIYSTRDFSTKNPAAMRAFVKTTYESARYCNANPTASEQIMADFIGVPLDVMQKVPRVELGYELVLSQVQSIIDAAAKYEIIAHGFPARELVDPNVSFR